MKQFFLPTLVIMLVACAGEDQRQTTIDGITISSLMLDDGALEALISNSERSLASISLDAHGTGVMIDHQASSSYQVELEMAPELEELDLRLHGLYQNAMIAASTERPSTGGWSECGYVLWETLCNTCALSWCGSSCWALDCSGSPAGISCSEIHVIAGCGT